MIINEIIIIEFDINHHIKKTSQTVSDLVAEESLRIKVPLK